MNYSLVKTGAWALIDPTYPHRWHGVIGDVQKIELGQGFPVDDTTGDPTQMTITVTEAGAGNTTIVNATTAGGGALITTAAGEYDGINAQYKGEAFKLTADSPLYFGAKLKVSDADNVDLLIGLAETDTALLATGTAHATDYGTSDFIGFLSLDATTTISTQTVLDGDVTASANSSTALEDDTYITLEIYWDGDILGYYVNGSKITQVTASLPDGDLTPTINFRTGEAAANTCNVKFSVYQVN